MKFIGLNHEDYFNQFEYICGSTALLSVSEEHKLEVKNVQQILVTQFSELGNEDDDWIIGYDVDCSKLVYGEIYSNKCLTKVLFNLILNVLNHQASPEEWVFHCKIDCPEETVIDEFFANDNKIYFYLNKGIRLEDIFNELG